MGYIKFTKLHEKCSPSNVFAIYRNYRYIGLYIYIMYISFSTTGLGILITQWYIKHNFHFTRTTNMLSWFVLNIVVYVHIQVDITITISKNQALQTLYLV